MEAAARCLLSVAPGATSTDDHGGVHYMGTEIEHSWAMAMSWTAFGLSVVILVFYAYHRWKATCGWEESYVCTIELIKVILEIFFETYSPATITQENGIAITWLRYAEWLLTCPVILIHLSNLTGLQEEYSRRTMVLLVSDIGTIVMGVTAALAARGPIKIVFFLLGLCYGVNTFYNAAQVYIESYHTVPDGRCKQLVKVMAWVYFLSWGMFPVLFLMGPEGFGHISPYGSIIGHTFADLLSKNLWGLLGHHLRVTIRQHILVHGDVRKSSRVRVAGREVQVETFVSDEGEEGAVRGPGAAYARRHSFATMAQAMRAQGINVRASIDGSAAAPTTAAATGASPEQQQHQSQHSWQDFGDGSGTFAVISAGPTAAAKAQAASKLMQQQQQGSALSAGGSASSGSSPRSPQLVRGASSLSRLSASGQLPRGLVSPGPIHHHGLPVSAPAAGDDEASAAHAGFELPAGPVRVLLGVAGQPATEQCRRLFAGLAQELPGLVIEVLPAATTDALLSAAAGGAGRFDAVLLHAGMCGAGAQQGLAGTDAGGGGRGLLAALAALGQSVILAGCGEVRVLEGVAGADAQQLQDAGLIQGWLAGPDNSSNSGNDSDDARQLLCMLLQLQQARRTQQQAADEAAALVPGPAARLTLLGQQSGGGGNGRPRSPAGLPVSAAAAAAGAASAFAGRAATASSSRGAFWDAAGNTANTSPGSPRGGGSPIISQLSQQQPLNAAAGSLVSAGQQAGSRADGPPGPAVQLAAATGSTAAGGSSVLLGEAALIQQLVAEIGRLRRELGAAE